MNEPFERLLSSVLIRSYPWQSVANFWILLVFGSLEIKYDG